MPCAKTLIEKEDFIISTITRDEYGERKSWSVAHILQQGVADPDSTWTHGIQQLAHARLDENYKDEINRKQRWPFSCDAETPILDSKNIKTSLQFYGEFKGYTGTAGSEPELQEINKDNYTIFQLPPYTRSLLQLLNPIFSKENNRWCFGPRNYYDAIARSINRNRTHIKEDSERGQKQPVLIFVKNIADAEEMFSQLKISIGDFNQINMHHPDKTVSFSSDGKETDLRETKGGEKAAKQYVIKQGGKGNVITITTGDQMGIGTDIKSKNLFVITADFFRQRKEAQYQKRTARGGEHGKAITTLDAEKFAKAHGVTFKWYDNKQQKLRAIQKQLDREAKVERKYRNQIATIEHQCSQKFDRLIQQEQDQASRELIKTSKIDFIDNIKRKWEELLAGTDPDALRPNPYIFYKGEGDQKTLDINPRPLNTIVSQFKTYAQTEFNKQIAALSEDGEIKAEPGGQHIDKNELQPPHKGQSEQEVGQAVDKRSTCGHISAMFLNETIRDQDYWRRLQLFEYLKKEQELDPPRGISPGQLKQFNQSLIKLNDDRRTPEYTLIQALNDTCGNSISKRTKMAEWLNKKLASLAASIDEKVQNEDGTPDIHLTNSDIDIGNIKKDIVNFIIAKSASQCLLLQQLGDRLKNINTLSEVSHAVQHYATEAENDYGKKHKIVLQFNALKKMIKNHGQLAPAPIDIKQDPSEQGQTIQQRLCNFLKREKERIQRHALRNCLNTRAQEKVSKITAYEKALKGNQHGSEKIQINEEKILNQEVMIDSELVTLEKIFYKGTKFYGSLFRPTSLKRAEKDFVQQISQEDKKITVTANQKK